jgi:hypothetical protein
MGRRVFASNISHSADASVARARMNPRLAELLSLEFIEDEYRHAAIDQMSRDIDGIFRRSGAPWGFGDPEGGKHQRGAECPQKQTKACAVAQVRAASGPQCSTVERTPRQPVSEMDELVGGVVSGGWSTDFDSRALLQPYLDSLRRHLLDEAGSVGEQAQHGHASGGNPPGNGAVNGRTQR